MKPIFYAYMITVLVLSSCSSGKTTFERGNYYEAVITSVNRLRRNSDHKKSVETLRQAYPLAVTFYEDRAKTSLASNEPFKWTEVVNSYTTINVMHDEIKRCPGALAVIPNPVNYYSKLQEAKQHAAEEHYAAGILALQFGDRENAKKAYRLFQKANEFVPGYKEVNNYLEASLAAATLKILVEPIPVQSKSVGVSAEFFNDKISEFVHGAAINEFVRFYTRAEAQKIKLKPDHIIQLQFDDFNVGQVYKHEKEVQLVKDSVVLGTYVSTSSASNTSTGDAGRTTTQGNNFVTTGTNSVNTRQTSVTSPVNTDTNTTTTSTNATTTTNTTATTTQPTNTDAERIAREQAAARELAEKQRLEKEAADKALAQKLKAEREAAERERLAREAAQNAKAQADLAERQRIERETAEKAAAEKAVAEKAAAEKAAAEKAAAEKAAAEKAAAEKAAAEKAAAEKAAAEKAAAEKAAAEKAAKEKAEKEKAEKEKAEKDKAKFADPTIRKEDTTDVKDPVTICHIPPGNKMNARTLVINRAALKAHLDHGDSQGGCGDGKEEKGQPDEKGNKPGDKNNDNKNDKSPGKKGTGKLDRKQNEHALLYQPGQPVFASIENDPDQFLRYMDMTSVEGDTNKVYGTVKATLYHFTKTTTSKGVVSFRIVDAKTGALLTAEKLPGEFVWVSEWATFNGDERALSPEQLRLTQLREQPAPAAQDLFIEFTRPIYDQITAKIQDFYKNY